LGHTGLSSWQTILADIKSLGFFCKTADTFHVFPETAEPGPAENVFGLVDALAVLDAGDFVVVSAVDSVGAAPPGEEEAVVGGSLFIEEVSCGIADI
jgi:hypothetical protein